MLNSDLDAFESQELNILKKVSFVLNTDQTAAIECNNEIDAKLLVDFRDENDLSIFSANEFNIILVSFN